jgi:hypothetical protein
VEGAHSSGLRRQGREANHLTTTSGKVKKIWIYVYTSYIRFPMCLHGVECREIRLRFVKVWRNLNLIFSNHLSRVHVPLPDQNCDLYQILKKVETQNRMFHPLFVRQHAFFRFEGGPTWLHTLVYVKLQGYTCKKYKKLQWVYMS